MNGVVEPILRSSAARVVLALAVLALLAPLASGCGGRTLAPDGARPDSDSLTPAVATNLPEQGTYCPTGTAHANLCCTTTSLDLTTCQHWTEDPLRACPPGTVTNPDPDRCCALDDTASCAPAPTGGPAPLSSQCNMVCPPGTTYVGPTIPPATALPDDVCAGPPGTGATTALGPPEEPDASVYSAPPFDMCATCPPGWEQAPTTGLCCRATTPTSSGPEECFSLAYDPPSASPTGLGCTGPQDYSSCVCSDVAAGHAYAMSCVASGSAQALCTCQEDGATTTTFTTTSDVLNPYGSASSAAFSTGCGFPFGAQGGGGSSGPAGG